MGEISAVELDGWMYSFVCRFKRRELVGQCSCSEANPRVGASKRGSERKIPATEGDISQWRVSTPIGRSRKARVHVYVAVSEWRKSHQRNIHTSLSEENPNSVEVLLPPPSEGYPICGAYGWMDVCIAISLLPPSG